jgi:dTDP-4-dehydrorhamnose 3,5-epimerase
MNPKEHPIEGVVLQPLRVFEDERGAVMHMLRVDSLLFKRFGEVYFSEVRPGSVKAWKRHTRMTQHFTVPVGRIRFVLYDDRPGSPTAGSLSEIELGRPDDYRLLVIPPGIWYGFTGLAAQPSLVANCADLPHDPSESENLVWSTPLIPYDWKGRNEF